MSRRFLFVVLVSFAILSAIVEEVLTETPSSKPTKSWSGAPESVKELTPTPPENPAHHENREEPIQQFDLGTKIYDPCEEGKVLAPDGSCREAAA